jgi:hypothetical protein
MDRVVEPLVGGFTIRTARSGRLLVCVEKGESHRLICRSGDGDRTWNNWEERMPMDENAYGIARRETNGGGSWVELLIVPVDRPYKTAQQARYENELKEVG